MKQRTDLANIWRYCLLVLFACRNHLAADTDSDMMAPNAPFQWKTIASVDGMDKVTQHLVVAILRENGIVTGMQGSVEYGILVPKNRAAETIAILKKDARMKDKKIWYVGDPLPPSLDKH